MAVQRSDAPARTGAGEQPRAAADAVQAAHERGGALPGGRKPTRVERGARSDGAWEHRRTHRARRLEFRAVSAASLPGQARLPPGGGQRVIDVELRVMSEAPSNLRWPAIPS